MSVHARTALTLAGRELRAAREIGRLTTTAPALRAAPRGSRDVIVVPGYSTADAATVPLRRFLTSRGHRVGGWELGTNRGDVRANLPRFEDRVARLVDENGGRRVALVGWSLGGVFAREVARDRPELVSAVITMATPVFGPTPDGADTESEAAAARIRKRLERPIEAEIAAFYSRRDAVVDWRRCIDRLNPTVDHVEVESSHFGITLDPDVWLGVARRLAGAEGRPDEAATP